MWWIVPGLLFVLVSHFKISDSSSVDFGLHYLELETFLFSAITNPKSKKLGGLCGMKIFKYIILTIGILFVALLAGWSLYEDLIKKLL
jgi:uncharacterized YccA/Bax inhibitor family protein